MEELIQLPLMPLPAVLGRSCVSPAVPRVIPLPSQAEPLILSLSSRRRVERSLIWLGLAARVTAELLASRAERLASTCCFRACGLARTGAPAKHDALSASGPLHVCAASEALQSAPQLSTSAWPPPTAASPLTLHLLLILVKRSTATPRDRN